MRRALGAGKHVLSQKPFALDLPTARELVEAADGNGVKLAVNQNGRWAPAWRIATLLLRQGAVGDIVAVTHLHDRQLPPLVGTPFDDLEHFLIYDYSIHWIDISRCWLDGKAVTAVRAIDYRTPNQPAGARSPWAAWIAIDYADGANVMIRSAGDAKTKRPGCPFWIHGTEGTLRGSVLLGSDFVELDRDGVFTRYLLEGAWFVDGFAGAMGELLSAIAEGREPYNTARHNLLSLRMTLAACRSAEEGGRPVSLDELPA
jgi:predicted dehydrogenase